MTDTNETLETRTAADTAKVKVGLNSAWSLAGKAGQGIQSACAKVLPYLGWAPRI